MLWGVIVVPGDGTASVSMFGFWGIPLEIFEPLGSHGKRSGSSGGMDACVLPFDRLPFGMGVADGFSRLDFGLFGEVVAKSGGGKVITLLFAREGAKVVVTYHSGEDRAKAVIDEIGQEGGIAKAYRVDVADENEVKGWFATVDRDFGDRGCVCQSRT